MKTAMNVVTAFEIQSRAPGTLEFRAGETHAFRFPSLGSLAKTSLRTIMRLQPRGSKQSKIVVTESHSMSSELRAEAAWTLIFLIITGMSNCTECTCISCHNVG